jgi:hypothetical protein
LVVTLAVLLDNAPRASLGSGTIFAAELAVVVAKCPSFDVHIVAAINTFFPI